MTTIPTRYVIVPSSPIQIIDPLDQQPLKAPNGKPMPPVEWEEFVFRLLQAPMFTETVDTIAAAQKIWEAVHGETKLIALFQDDWVRLVSVLKSLRGIFPYSAPVLWQLKPYFHAILAAEPRPPTEGAT